ncbi:MAG: tRNA lysidine(34) synthetase TilS [Bacillus sp. (in: firmicutes)]
MFEKRVNDLIEKRHLLKQGDRILVGVSGGPDSLALLHYLASVKGRFDLHIVAAHVDHMFRGQESYEDYLFVEEICKKWDIPFEGTRVDVPRYIKETAKSPQVAARELRYGFYKDCMVRRELDKLALGHHGDDQMETMLMRIARGATGSARAGIPVKRSWDGREIIRPFLSVTKKEIEQYCVRNGLEPRIDKSNEKPSYTRNRIRKDILPALKRENPKAHEHFQRFSEQLREDEDFLWKLAQEKLEPFWVRKQGFSEIEICSFLQMSKPLQRRAIQLILNYLYFERHEELSALHIESIIHLLQSSHPSGELHLPGGLRVIRSYEKCLFAFSQKKMKPYSLSIRIPGMTTLPDGRTIHAVYSEKQEGAQHGNDVFCFEAGSVRLPLTVRSRLNGDRIQLKGLTGSKKVKDIFIDAKIPVAERDVWPIVEDGDGNIIWIPGLKKSNQDSKGEQASFITLKYV